MEKFVDDGLFVPESCDTERFHFRVLSPRYAEPDFAAVYKAMAHIRRLHGITDPAAWPNDTLTLEQDILELAEHEDDFYARRAFAYTVLDTEDRECLGCVYIDPARDGVHDAVVTLWGLDDEGSAALYRATRAFVDEYFRFRAPSFPAFETPVTTWRGK